MTERLLDFWALFATERAEVAGGTGLISRPTPLSFANGVWEPDPQRLAEADDWCRRHDLPAAALIAGPIDGAALPADRSIETLLTASLLVAEETPPDLHLEQIGWLHTRPLAELFCYRYDRMDIEIDLAATVAAAMEREPRLDAFLAYDDAGAGIVGAALAYAPTTASSSSAAEMALVWAEELRGAAVAAAVAARIPDASSYRLVASAARPSTPQDDEAWHISRIALAD